MLEIVILEIHRNKVIAFLKFCSKMPTLQIHHFLKEKETYCNTVLKVGRQGHPTWAENKREPMRRCRNGMEGMLAEKVGKQDGEENLLASVAYLGHC